MKKKSLLNKKLRYIFAGVAVLLMAVLVMNKVTSAATVTYSSYGEEGHYVYVNGVFQSRAGHSLVLSGNATKGSWTCSECGYSRSWDNSGSGSGGDDPDPGYDPGTTTYKVYHWQMNLDGANYTLAETDTLSGAVGASVTPSVRNYTGFTSPSAQTVTVNHAGGTAVNYYYSRNQYYLDLNGCLDGTLIYSIDGCGTANIYINDNLVASGVADYYAPHYYGSTYNIELISVQPGKNYKGYTGNSYGTIGVGTTELFINFTSSYTVTCEDWFVDSSNTKQVYLRTAGSNTYEYGQTASGGDWGNDSINGYYAYHDCSSATVTGDLTVYRYYHVWVDINIFNPSGVQDSQSAYFDLTVNNTVSTSNYYNLVNEPAEGGTYNLPYGSVITISNLRPYGDAYTYSSCTGCTESNGTWTYTVVGANDMNIYMAYIDYIHHWSWGFVNGEGNNGDKYGFHLGDSTFSATTGQSVTLSTSQALTPPNGFYLSDSFGTGDISGTWTVYPFPTTFTQNAGVMGFEYDYHPYTYNITYHMDGGTNNASNPATYNVLYGVTFANPTKAGFTFAGWKDSNGNPITGINQGQNATFSSPEDMYNKLASRTTGNIDVYATWTSYSANLMPRDIDSVLYNNETLAANEIVEPRLDGSGKSDKKTFYAIGAKRAGKMQYTSDLIKTITLINLDSETAPATYVDTWDVSNENNGNVTAWLVSNASDNTKYDLTIGFYGTELKAPESSVSLFAVYPNCTSINGLEKLDTSNVISMNGMFKCNSGLTSINTSTFDTSNVIDMVNMFYKCVNLVSVDVSAFDTSNVKSFAYMFMECNNLPSVDVSHFDTSQAENLEAMFSGCNKLETINVSNFDTSNVESMAHLFYGCSKVKALDVSNWDTSKVKNMETMFYSCYEVENLDVSNFNTSNVEDMEYMFYGCVKLTSLDVTNFNTSSVKDMNAMFDGCATLTTLDLSSFDTRKVTNMSWMFYRCENLTSLNVTNFNTSNVRYIHNMFRECTSITTLDLSSFDMTNVVMVQYMLYNMSSLQALKTPRLYSSSNVTLPRTLVAETTGQSYTEINSTTPKQTWLRLAAYRVTYNGTNTVFGSLKDAIDSVPANGTATITVLRNVEDSSEAIIPSGETITLDTNGKTLGLSATQISYDTLTTYSAIINNGGLNITGNGTIKLNSASSTSSALITNYGTFTLSTATLLNDISDSVYNLYNVGGNVTINSGIIKTVTNGSYAVGIEMKGTNPKCTINGGQIIAEGTGNLGIGIEIMIHSPESYTINSETIVNDGYISGTIYGIAASTGTGSIKVKGGQVISTTYDAIAAPDGVSVYIGQEGGGVSQDSPVIQGLNAVRADFRFYDGILKGSEAAYIFAPTAVETGYAVKDGTSGGYQTATLHILNYTFSLKGNNPEIQYRSSTSYYNYIDKGYNFSTSDGLTVEQSGTVIDGRTTGTYTITYNVKNGNTVVGTHTRTVRIIDDSWPTTEYTDGNFVYLKNSTNEFAKIIKYTDTSATSIVFPSTIGGLPVVEIGDNGNKNIFNATTANTTLTSVTLPHTLIRIGEYAFYYCQGLSKVNLESTAASAGQVLIPESVMDIYDFAFKYCKALTTLNLPGTVRYIKDSFLDCTGMTSLTFNEGLKQIAGEDFYNCKKITGTVTLPASLATINSNPFGNVTISAVAVASGNTAFTVENGILFNKAKTVLITYPKMKTATNGTYTIPDGVTEIRRRSFQGNSSLTSITFPSSGFKTIASFSFQGLSNITSMTLPNTITYIGTYAFSDCSALTNVTWPTGFHTIQDYTFRNCTSLTNWTVPDHVTAINQYAYMGCTKLETLVIGTGVTTIGTGVFRNDAALTAIIMNKPVSAAADVPTLTATEIASYRPANAIVYVPNTTAEGLYKAAANWSTEFGASRIKPMLEINSSSQNTYNVGETYTEDGYTVFGYNVANADKYTSLGYTVVQTGTVNTAVPGEYNLTYQLQYNGTDIAGATVSRTVTVNRMENGMLPNNQVVYVQSSTPLSALVSNNVGGALSASIKPGTDNEGGTTKASINGSNFVAGTLAAGDDSNKTVTVIVTAAETTNYAEKSVEVVVTVQKYTNTLSITAPTSATLTYGETATVTATPQTNGGTNGAITYTSGTPSVVTVSNTTLKAVAGSGSSVIIASMAGTETVKAATATKTITVAKRAITIKAKDQTINYGATIDNNTNQVTIGGSGLVSRHILSNITLTSNETSGTIMPSATIIKDGNNQDVTTNYQITYEAGNLTINESVATAPTVTAYDGTYDGTAHGVTVSNVSGGTLVYSENGTNGWTTSPITRTEVGETIVYVKVSGDRNHKDSSVVTTKITINPRAVTITAKAQSIPYGTTIANNTNQITVSGLAAGHTVGAITLTQSTTSVTTNGTIRPSAAVINDASNHEVTANYQITYQTGNLTITESSATDPIATAYAGTYDGAAHGITVSNVIGGTVVYSANGTNGWSVNPITRTDVGEITVFVKISGDSNHTDSRVVSAKITITKRPITITAKDQTVTYGTAIDNSTSQVVIGGNGLVSRHTLSTITLTQSTTNATTNGTITAGAATIKDGNNQNVTGNYQITYKTGKLTINKLTATVPTATAYAGTYDGTAHGITVSNVSGGTVVYSANGTSDWSASPITRTLAGETTVYAKVLGDSNHADSAVVSAKITIAQRELTITAKDQTVNYGIAIANNTNQVTLSGSGLATGDSLNTITLTQSTTSATINGTINPSNAVILNSTSANVADSYRITYVGGALTINKVQAVAPTLTAYTGTYDEAAHGITVSGGSGGTIVYRDSVTGEWSATPITKTLPGETTVYVKVQGDSNHTDSEVKSAKITINKRTITDLIINGSNFVYTGSRITPEVTVKYGTTVLTEGTDYTLTFTNNINVGTTSVTATAIADSVYTGTITKTFTIKAAEFTGSVKILGQNIFGETLTADASAIRPEDTTITYKWYSGDPAHGGTVIGTSNSLVLDNAGYVGTDIYVVVTATKDNYATKSFTDQADVETNGYAKVEKAERTISVEDTLDLTYGTSGKIDFTYTGDDVTATATSTNGSVVSVAMNDGVNNGSVTVTPTGAGNTTVKITIPESGGYKKVEATVNVTVNAATMSGDVKITGTNTYGETLTADTTGIRPTGATVRYQWYYSDNNATTGGIPITTGGNGASLVLNNATYVGKHIYVEVIAEKNGYTTKTYVDFADSDSNGTDIVSKADRSISMSPTQNVIFGQTGTLTFTYTGNDVTATAKTTDENIATVTMADGNNRGTVTITPVKVGTTAITVTIPESATHKGITENCALTVEEATMTGTVKVTGENTYGKTLTADTSAIRPTGATFTYKWYAGTELVGTNSTYVVGENAVGKVIKLVVTASMENYDDYTVEDVTDNSNNATATASKANGWVELAESTGTAFYGTEERSVIITRHHGGTLTASIVGTSTASVAIDTSDSQEKAKITNVNSVNAGNNIRIRVKSAETNVYKAATADFVLTITRSEMSGSISVSGTAASGETITVDASHIYPTGCELKYEWYVSHVKPDSNNSTGTGRSGLPADAVKISGASGSSYQIGTDLDDVYIYVVVKAHDPHNNYEDTEYVAGRTNSVDGAGPELGKITVLNADKTGTVNGNSVEIEIRECYDESGIASYEWQYSTDGIHWTTVKKDTSGESHSEFTHAIPKDDQSADTLYYRVIVNDIYGNSSTSDIVIVHRKDILNRKGTIRFTTTQTSNEEVVIHTVIKTTTDVVSVKVNGSTFDYTNEKYGYKKQVSGDIKEITVIFNYPAQVNGNFVFEVTDKLGNVVKESINVSTIATTDVANITYTVKGATIFSNAQIIFTSNEAMKIKNPNRYTGITFDTKGYATRITATIDKGASFNAGTEFIFESRNHIDTTVEVEEAILTEVEYVRFTGQNASAREIDSNKVEALASGVSSAQVNVSGTIYSYYGFGPSKPSTSVATSTDLSAAATLGSASKTYSVGVDKQISEMESSGKASVSSASGYTNGNTTGTSSTVSSESFRLKLVPQGTGTQDRDGDRNQPCPFFDSVNHI